MNNVVEFITALGGLSGIAAIIWAIINWRSRKKVEGAKAESASAEADSKVSDNWARYAEKLEKRVEELEEKQKKSDAKVQKYFQFSIRIAQALSSTTAKKRYAEYHICTDIGCSDRKPSLGTFATEDLTAIIREMEAFEKEEEMDND